MRSRWITKLVLPMFAGVTAACSDGLGPGDSRDFLDLELDFCANEAPIFLAFQNEAGPWERVIPNGNQTFGFRAADRVALAMIFQFGNEYTTEVVYAQNDELLPLSGGACTEVSGSKSLNGSVASVSSFDFAGITMGLSEDFVEPPPSTFTLTQLANGPLDLIAHRGRDLSTGAVPNSVIIRRSVNQTTGSDIDVLDFASSEAEPATSNSLTINGLGAGEENLIDLFFETATTFGHALFLSNPFVSSTQAIHHVPSVLTQAGDLHVLDMYATTLSGNAYRGEVQFYRNPGNKSTVLGPALNAPTITTVASSPSARLRAQLVAQSDYPSFVLALYDQGGGARQVSVLGTAAYFNSPQIWDLVMPDLSGVSGFPTLSGLQSGASVETQVVGYNGDIATFFGASAENIILRYAARLSAQTALRTIRGDGGRLEQRRSRPASTLARRRLRGG